MPDTIVNKKEISIESVEQLTDWQLFDLNGKLMEAGKINSQKINFKENFNGFFILKLKTANQKIFSQKIKLSN